MSCLKKIAVCLGLLASSAVAVAQESQHGDFLYVPNKDAFTDADRSLILTVSESTGGRNASLGWKCMEDGLNVIYIFDKYLGGDSDEEVRVRYRIDKQPAKGPEYWSLLQGQEGTYMPMGDIGEFTRQALAGTSIVVEVVDPLDGESLRDTFGLQGLGSALGKLSCRG